MIPTGDISSPDQSGATDSPLGRRLHAIAHALEAGAPLPLGITYNRSDDSLTVHTRNPDLDQWRLILHARPAVTRTQRSASFPFETTAETPSGITLLALSTEAS